MNKVNWWIMTTALIIAFAVIGFFATREINVNAEDHKTIHTRITAQDTKNDKLCSRVDKLEENYKTTISSMKEDIGEMRDDVKDIKILLFKAAGAKEER